MYYKTYVNEKLCPEFVIVTQAPEDYCRAHWKHSSGKGMNEFEREMESFKKNSQSNGQSLTDFFQETIHGMDPISNVGKKPDDPNEPLDPPIARRAVLNLPIAGKDPEDAVESARIYMDGSATGRPFNYLRTEDTIHQELLQLKAEDAAKKAREQAEKERALSEDKSEELEDLRKSKIRLNIIAKHEADQKQLQGMPLRAYLMEHMVPSLTEGLIELCKVLPEDPVDYLANYLENHAASVNSSESSKR